MKFSRTMLLHANRSQAEEMKALRARLAEAEKRIASLRALGPHLRTAAIVDDWQTFDELLRDLEADSASNLENER